MGEVNTGYELDGTVTQNGDGHPKEESKTTIPMTEAKDSEKTPIINYVCGIFAVALIAAAITLILVLTLRNTPSEEEEIEICLQQIEPGSCDSFTTRWGYDSDLDRCVTFTYGGCDGNQNNFLIEDDCQSICGDAGGLPSTVMQLQDTPLSTKDVTYIFGTTYLLNDVAPPSERTGTLRQKGALPTHNFACNQINHGPLSPIRQFPHSATMSPEGMTYDAYTLDRWTALDREDPSYQLTPGQKDKPWVKLGELGGHMKQMVSAPDGTPLAIFSGLSGIQVGMLESGGEPIMTDFGEMFANFLFTDQNGGTMETPLVRGSAMLTHLFNNTTPLLKPYCLVAINGEDTSFECPEELSVEDPGSGFVEASCESTTGILSLVLHLTKPISDITGVQWAATESTEWETTSEMFTCDVDSCDLSTDGLTVTIDIAESNNTMYFAINVLHHWVVPQHDYSYYWLRNPAIVTCEDGSDPLVFSGSIMPPWFYGTVTAEASFDGSGNLVISAHLSGGSAGQLQEIQYLISASEDWPEQSSWQTCRPEICTLYDNNNRVSITVPKISDITYYAVNTITQYVITPEPHNWRTQPLEIRSEAAPPKPTPSPIAISGSKSFIFELSEPADALPGTTRKFVTYFSEEVNLQMTSIGASISSPNSDSFTGTMQLVYAGTGPKGDFTQANSLNQYAGVYSYKPKTRFGADTESPDKGYISFDWNKMGADFFGQNPEENLLMIALPHHEELLGSGNLIDTPFGFKGHVGDVWVMEETLPRASMEPIPEAVASIKDNPTRLQAILDAIQKDADYQTIATNCIKTDAQSYWSGKDIAMVARLASMSRAFDTDHYQKLDEDIRFCLDRWLRIIDGELSIANIFKYDNVWGGMMLRGAQEWEEVFPWTNFGFSSYADHHFHLGLWIYAIAYYSKYHMDWAMKEGNYDRIMALARDVANPSEKDSFFPTVRHKDWYFGSSWATGIGGGTRQEESSSEAICCYHAIAALGEVFDDPNLMAIGQLTLATEIRATRHYWHVRPYNRHLFPPTLQKWGVLGQLQEDGIFYYTLNWECEPDQFPQRHACLVGIQIIPIISVSHLYMDQEWAVNVQDVCNWAIDPTTAPGAELVDTTRYTMEPVHSKWQAFCQSILAKVDEAAQTRAADYIMSVDTDDLEPGTGLASTLLFIWESS